MPLTSRDDIFARKPKIDTEEAPFLGDSLVLMGMTGEERGIFENSVVKLSKAWKMSRPAVYRGLLIAHHAVDEHGKRLFSDADAKELGTFPARELEPAVAVAMRLSGIGEAERKELEGNSEPGLSAGRGSD